MQPKGQNAGKVERLAEQAPERGEGLEVPSPELTEVPPTGWGKVALNLRHVRMWLIPPGSLRARLARGLLNRFLHVLRLVSRRRAAALIRGSELFDPQWYRAHNPDVTAAGMDPALHYLLFGGFEMRDPGPDFSSGWYLEEYSDVEEAGINPLLHYLRYGKREGRAPAPELGGIRTEPIIVYQMGKVGSTTVQQSLVANFKSLGLDVPVYDYHGFNRIERLELFLLKRAKEGHQVAASLQVVRQAMAFKKEMSEKPNQSWNLVSLVRDPIARTVSAFFQGLPEIVPDWKQLYGAHDLTLGELRELYLGTFNQHAGVGEWFDVQMKPVFGIDVYASPFSAAAGYKIYPTRGNVRLLVIRLEDLDRVAGQALEAFLGLSDFQLVNTNVARDKDYSSLYEEWLKMPLPVAYVKKMYRTRYARHFYTPEELEAFAHRWTQR